MNERGYIIWQNRSFRFYLAARVLVRHDLVGPAAFCGQQAIELLMKATLVYWDKGFVPEDAGHAVAKMARMIRNKVGDGKKFECPEYFYSDKRFQEVSRYPKPGKGVFMPATFSADLDAMFCDLVRLVPFQFNGELGRAVDGRDRRQKDVLADGNASFGTLRAWVGPRARVRRSVAARARRK